MQDTSYLRTVRFANSLIKISVILTIMGVIAMKTGLLGDEVGSKNKVPTTQAQTVLVLAEK